VPRKNQKKSEPLPLVVLVKFYCCLAVYIVIGISATFCKLYNNNNYKPQKQAENNLKSFRASRKKTSSKNHNISPTSMGRRLFSRLLLLAPATKCSYPDSTSLDFFFTLKLTRVGPRYKTKTQNAADMETELNK